MGKLARISPYVNLPAASTPEEQWQRLPQAKRAMAEARLRLLRPALDLMGGRGISQTKAVKWLRAQARVDNLPDDCLRAVEELGGVPGVATLQRWVKGYREQGLPGLADLRLGKQHKTEGWEARAAQLWQRPSQPTYSAVAGWLQDEGFEGVTYNKVRRYLQSLPGRVGEKSAARMGAHYYRQNIGKYRHMDASHLPVGFAYQSDGHLCKVYVAHPATGMPWRPELTIYIDVRSKYLVSWHLSEAESAQTTMFSLVRAVTTHDHVLAVLHTDPGSGFANTLLDAEVTGFLKRMNITHMTAHAGNAKGKGLVEGWFHPFEEHVGKRFDTYCGYCRTDDALKALEKKVRRGDLKLPTLDQYMDAIRAYVERYNTSAKAALGGQAPAELWAELERVPPEMPPQTLLRPQVKRTVRRGEVQLFNRTFANWPVLADFHEREVVVEYDWHSFASVTIRDADQRFICDAELVKAAPYLPPSRVEDIQQNRLKGQVRRLRHKAEEAAARLRPTYDHTDTLDAIEHLAPASLLEEAPKEKEADALPDIDLYNTDYLDEGR